MLTSIALLWKASGLNKLWPYISVGLITVAIIVGAYIQGRSSGSQNANNKQLTDSLSRMHREAKDRATIQSIDSSIARKQLRERWSAK